MQRTSLKLKEKSNKKNLALILLLLLFIIGMLYGSLLAKSQAGDLPEKLKLITSNYLSNRSKLSIIQVFINSFFSSLIFLLIPYFLGFSAIGQLGSGLVPLFKGLGLGASMALFYMNYGINGIGYCALIIIPQTAVSLFAIIIGCRESIKLSNIIFLNFIDSKEKTISISTIKLYHIKFFILLLFIIFSAIIDTISGIIFSGVFNINS